MADNTMVTIPVGYIAISTEEYCNLINEKIETRELLNRIKDYVQKNTYVSEKSLRNMLGIEESEED